MLKKVKAKYERCFARLKRTKVGAADKIEC